MEQIGHESGFTLIELIVTIVIIGILASLVVIMPTNYLKTSRDQERGDDTSSIARRLEQAYNFKDLGYPGYPSTVELANDISTGNRTLDRLRPEAFQSPGATTSSVIAATSTSNVTPAGVGSPTIKQYVYQPLRADGALCTANPSSATPCTRFFIYFRSEATGNIQTIKSIRQQ